MKGPKMDWISSALVFASGMVVILTFLQQRQQGLEALEAKENQVTQKNEIIAELKGLITGADSYIFIQPSKVVNTDDMLFHIEFRGKYPVYDTTVEIEEFDYRVVAPGFFQYQRTGQRTVQLGTLTPLRREVIFPLKVPKLEGSSQFGKRFFFRIVSRNGLIEEDVHVRQEGPHFSHAFKVIRFKPDYSDPTRMGIGGIEKKVRHIDPAFPVHELDHLQGDSGWYGDFEVVSGTNIYPSGSN